MKSIIMLGVPRKWRPREPRGDRQARPWGPTFISEVRHGGHLLFFRRLLAWLAVWLLWLVGLADKNRGPRAIHSTLPCSGGRERAPLWGWGLDWRAKHGRWSSGLERSSYWLVLRMAGEAGYWERNFSRGTVNGISFLCPIMAQRDVRDAKEPVPGKERQLRATPGRDTTESQRLGWKSIFTHQHIRADLMDVETSPLLCGRHMRWFGSRLAGGGGPYHTTYVHAANISGQGFDSSRLASWSHHTCLGPDRR